MLKALFGALSTGRFSHGSRVVSVADISPEFIKLLFSGGSFESDLGLYVRYKVNDAVHFGKKLTMAPVFLDGRPAGATITFGGISFLLSLLPKNQNFNMSHPDAKWLMRHPNALNHGDAPGGLEFIW